MKQRANGFTIVELLIVIVVIGILAAISIVAYNGVSNKANDSTVRNDLSNAAKQIELFKAENDRYPQHRTNDFSQTFKFSKSAYLTTGNNAMYCVSPANDQYALGVTSKSGARFLLTQHGIQQNVDVSATAVCNAVGTTWGTTSAHGYNPAGTAPSYTNGWNNSWNWTN